MMDEAIAKKLENFFSQFKFQRYKKGEILIRADEDPKGIFYLTQGYVKKYLISKKGEELVLNIFKPISFFPMSWAMNNTPNTYYYEAMTEVEITCAPAGKVVGFIKQEPEVLYDLMSRVYRGTDGLLIRMAYLMSGDAYSRLVTELLIVAKRFGRKDNSQIVTIKITEKDLASQTGMTHETVSRELKKLKGKEIVMFNKNLLTINNIEKLEEELGFPV